jgi:hypothetical protein
MKQPVLLTLFLLLVAAGPWLLNYVTQRCVLWAIVLLTLGACAGAPHLRDIRTIAIDGIDYVGHTPGGEF